MLLQPLTRKPRGPDGWIDTARQVGGGFRASVAIDSQTPGDGATIRSQREPNVGGTTRRRPYGYGIHAATVHDAPATASAIRFSNPGSNGPVQQEYR